MQNENKTSIISSSKGIGIDLKELYYYKELLFFFSWRDIKIKYKQTLLGFLWVIIQPILLAGIFILFFNQALEIETGSLPPIIFYLSGLIAWTLFSSGLSQGNTSLINNAHIIKKIYFPRIIVPISAILVSLFDFIISSLVFLIITLYYLFSRGAEIDLVGFIIIFPLGTLIIVITTIGLSLIVASFNVKYRDFRYIIPYFIQLLFFTTPVIYDSSFITNPIAMTITKINPIAGVINMYRDALLGNPIGITAVGISLIISISLFFIGTNLFARTERNIADLI